MMRSDPMDQSDNIKMGQNVVLGFGSANVSDGKFTNFGFFECVDVLEDDEFLLHGIYDSDDDVAARYNQNTGRAELLKDSDYLERERKRDVFYVDVFDTKYRYYLFADGDVKPRLSIIGDRDLHEELDVGINTEEKFRFAVQGLKFEVTRNNAFDILDGAENADVVSNSEVPFVFSAFEDMIVLDLDNPIKELACFWRSKGDT